MLTYKFRQDRDQFLVLTHQVLNFKTKSLAEPYFKRYGKKEINSKILAIFFCIFALFRLKIYHPRGSASQVSSEFVFLVLKSMEHVEWESKQSKLNSIYVNQDQ